MSDLFQSAGLENDAPRPLADRLRPTKLDDVVGQDHLLAKGAPLRRMLDAGRLSSLILWGPPGVGKTTIARLLADGAKLEFEQISAIFSGVADLRKVFERAKARRAAGKGTLLFVDEIHRFNKAQQDGFLPHVEAGVITLVGATTENPSFELNAALLSRAQVFTLNRLDDDALEQLLKRAEAEKGRTLALTGEARATFRMMADGDGRFVLNLAEEIFAEPEGRKPVEPKELAELVQRRAPVYDKGQESHYNLASALQKSIRGSDVDAALYWAARMLAGGEDPKFILRRLVVIASEDIGNADPQALPLAIAAKDAYEFLGQPEGEIAIGQLVAYLGTAPKSNRSHVAFKQAKGAARDTGSLMPPPHAMNAPTKLMKNLGYSEGYVYDHDTDEGFAGLNYFPPDMDRKEFYHPSQYGFDKEIAKRLTYWNKKRQEKSKG
ncbi:replication-associated recombination protein A [Hyphococcus flavus]|uniref:Replication-associated recombination protein A n=1 Tax=Hyphococcus flavus TaxID=1866326 RepID=A0AAE9ZAX8_9PROT|nr:replication-associated recombination protein A [Hyphococcus flavus]WDI31013.1 replication-associated recombination protein A [Hyphococcus flavus]